MLKGQAGGGGGFIRPHGTHQLLLSQHSGIAGVFSWSMCMAWKNRHHVFCKSSLHFSLSLVVVVIDLPSFILRDRDVMQAQ
jgi:hypothetical protein